MPDVKLQMPEIFEMSEIFEMPAIFKLYADAVSHKKRISIIYILWLLFLVNGHCYILLVI